MAPKANAKAAAPAAKAAAKAPAKAPAKAAAAPAAKKAAAKAPAKAAPAKAAPQKAGAKVAKAAGGKQAPKAAAKGAKAPGKQAAKAAAKQGAKVAAKQGAKPAGKAVAKVGGKGGKSAAVAKKGKKGVPSKQAKAPPKAKAPKPKRKLFDKRPRNFSVGNDLPPKRDLTRFVRWPKYVVLQRQTRVLQRRLKVPPALNQFTKTLDAHTKSELFKFARKYKPENPHAREKRLRKEAKGKAADKGKAAKGGKPPAKKPELKCGIQRVTRLVETKRAKMVLIAHDVDPIEIVIWLPALCKKMEVPYAIVKSKAALGRLVGFKKASCVAFVNVRSEDNNQFNKLVEAVNTSFNDRFEDIRRQWGGKELGRKARALLASKRTKA